METISLNGNKIKDERYNIINIKFRGAGENPNVLYWYMVRGDASIEKEYERISVIMVAFRIWSEVIPINFRMAGNIYEANIWVMFVREQHYHCERPFDGQGGELAHSWAGGDIHFDNDEDFKKMKDFKEDGINLLKVTLHEVGHLLGLPHSQSPYSIMYPIYDKLLGGTELTLEDRDAVKNIFGVCKENIDSVFDFINFGGSGKNIRFSYNTYFFKDTHYWLYLNRNNRTRSGDPISIPLMWEGIPKKPIQAIVQPFTKEKPLNYLDTYFFIGDHVYKYGRMVSDDPLSNKSVLPGWPKRLETVFPSAPHLPILTGPVDSTYFDYESDIYIFKGNGVWICNRDLINKPNCCHSYRKFTDLFETMATPQFPQQLTSIDIVFYSLSDDDFYFFKDKVVYVLTDIGLPKQYLVPKGFYWQQWKDVCDV